MFFAADFSNFSPRCGSPGFAEQFDFRLNNFLNAVTEATFSRDGMTPFYSRLPETLFAVQNLATSQGRR